MSSEIFEHSQEELVVKKIMKKNEWNEWAPSWVDVNTALTKLEELNRALLTAKEKKNGVHEVQLQWEITDLQHQILAHQQQNTIVSWGFSSPLASMSRENIIPAVSNWKQYSAVWVWETAKTIFPQRLTNLAGISNT